MTSTDIPAPERASNPAESPPKPHIEALVDGRFPVLTITDCLKHLGWTWDNSGEYDFNNITCSCGTLAKMGGWVGTEHCWCPSCGKGMQDLFGFLPHGNSCAMTGHIDKYQANDRRHWIPENVWGMGKVA